MIDFSKIRILQPNIGHLYQNKDLDFKRLVSEKTGELETKAIADYHTCRITIHDSGTVIFSGSIHKMYNSIHGITAPKPQGNGFNGNQFYWHEIKYCIDHLTVLFGVAPQQMHLLQIEFGQNLKVAFNPQLFIDGLLMHHGKPFEHRFKGFYAQSVHSNYIIKVYNKGNQYQMFDKVLRFEVKILEMRYQNNAVGISTFADIIPETLLKVFDFLMKELKRVTYFDRTIFNGELTKTEKKQITKYNNPNYWKDLPPHKRHEPRKKLTQLIEDKSNNLKRQICRDLERNRIIFRELSENKNRVIVRTSNIGRSTTLKCPITGLELEHEKGVAKYARTATLKKLKITNEERYLELCSILLSNSRKTPKFEDEIISHLAKQIRNRFYNPRKVKKTGYNKKNYATQQTLF